MLGEQEGQEVVDKKKTGRICLTDITPVYTKTETGPTPTLMKWGFPGTPKKDSKAKPPVIINARSETIVELPMFKKYLNQRCLVPASFYYEFSQTEVTPDKKKLAYEFRPRDETIGRIWMAAIYREVEDVALPVFTILTIDAPNCIKQIHTRMPVILRSKQARCAWMQGESDLAGLFHDGAIQDIVYKPAA